LDSGTRNSKQKSKTETKAQGGTRRYKEVQGGTRRYKEVQGEVQEHECVCGIDSDRADKELTKN
jgi:hypothetical protein